MGAAGSPQQAAMQQIAAASLCALDNVHVPFLAGGEAILRRPLEMWHVEKYQAGGKRPYLMARIEDFAALRAMVKNQRRDRVEIVAPADARAADLKKLRSLGAVHIQMQK
jgi:hypothetical protein